MGSSFLFLCFFIIDIYTTLIWAPDPHEFSLLLIFFAVGYNFFRLFRKEKVQLSSEGRGRVWKPSHSDDNTNKHLAYTQS